MRSAVLRWLLGLAVLGGTGAALTAHAGCEFTPAGAFAYADHDFIEGFSDFLDDLEDCDD